MADGAHRGGTSGPLVGSTRDDASAGSGPPCAICARTGEHPRRLIHLTHGVSVWLCETHASERFLRDDGGTRFAERLAGMWLATGALTARRAAALRSHIRHTRSIGIARDQPGSYSWPALRREAEQRFASGDDPRRVIQELRARYADCPAMAPSPRTMRRWYSQARWLAPPRLTPRQGQRQRRRRVPPGFELIPYALTQHLRWDYAHPFDRNT